MFTNVSDAIYYIEHIKRLSRRENLNRMKKALSLLDNPEKSYKSIHIAGTNGKGSTACYLKNILIEMGYKVGSFISPYVVKFNERIMINNNYISDDDIIKYTNTIKKITDKIYEEDNDIVTFFEFLTLMGFLYFKDNNIDYAIVEVGMGGILDATNVIDASARLITNIGFDHMSSLGNTLEEIADKKLGIVHNNDLLITTVSNSLIPYFKDKLSDITNDIHFIDTLSINTNLSLTGTSFTFENNNYHTPLLGKYQAYNASLAIKTINLLFPNTNQSIIQRGLERSFWPGRMEVVNKDPLIIIDGGHNIHGITALVDSIKELKGNSKVYTIFTALSDKETKKMIEKLETITDSFIFTEIEDSRAKSALLLKEESNIDSIVIKDYQKAIEETINKINNKDILLITGSLHFISYVRKYFHL